MAATDQSNSELRNDRSYPLLTLTGVGAPRSTQQRLAEAWAAHAPGMGREPPQPRPEGR